MLQDFEHRLSINILMLSYSKLYGKEAKEKVSGIA